MYYENKGIQEIAWERNSGKNAKKPRKHIYQNLIMHDEFVGQNYN